MAKIEVASFTLFTPMLVNGTNFGTNVNLKQKDAVAHYDPAFNSIVIQFKGKAEVVSPGNLSHWSPVNLSDVGLGEPEVVTETPTLPPAIAKARRGRPPMQQPEDLSTYLVDPSQPYDPNDEDAAAKHRAAVRAASANSNKPLPTLAGQNDLLIQQSRNAAAGVKTAQVSNPTLPAQGASVVGKPKAISHAQLRAQVAQEAKEVSPK